MQGRGAAAPAWLRELRERGASRFAAPGFPTMRQEDWRFTNVAPIAETPFRLADKAPTNAAELRRARRDSADRRAHRDPQRPLRAGAVEHRRACRRASSPAASRSAIADERARVRAPRSARVGSAAPFAALNTAFLEDGAFIVIPAERRARPPIHIVVVTGGAGKPMAHPRTLIVAGANSQARIAQTFIGAPGEAYFTNAVTEVVGRRERRRRSLHRSARVGHARFTSRRSRRTLGAKRDVPIARGHARREAPAQRHLARARRRRRALHAGRLLSRRRRSAASTTTRRIDHAMPHCTSHELYKGILAGKAQAVFNGRIIVRDRRAEDRRQADQPRAAAVGRRARSTRTRSSRSSPTT